MLLVELEYRAGPKYFAGRDFRPSASPVCRTAGGFCFCHEKKQKTGRATPFFVVAGLLTSIDLGWPASSIFVVEGLPTPSGFGEIEAPVLRVR